MVNANGGAAPSAPAPSQPSTAPRWLNVAVKLTILAVSVALVFYVLAFPHIVLAPTPRIIVLAVIALLPTVVITENIVAELRVEVEKKIYFHALGAAALVCFALWGLVTLSRPDIQRAIYHVKEKNVGDALWISADRDSAQVRATKRGGAPVMYVSNSTIILDFPEQVEQATLVLHDKAGGKVCERVISYTEEQVELVIPDDFKCEAR